ncbi:MAG: tryptophan halogenase family protein, partial [Pseudomonadota bacterium]
MRTTSQILVVGGGSAGWIMAAYLNAALNGSGRREADISLVESARIGRVGVGEATVPTIRHVLQTVGVDERTFLKAADATFKQAIRFDGWLKGGAERYHHPFDRRASGPVDRSALDWLESDRARDFSEIVSPQPVLAEMGLAPKALGSPDFSSPLPYAYHMDAEAFADHLADVATTAGVTRYIDDVVDIEQREDGDITAVNTKGGLRLEADLFVDCTGFAAILIGKTLGVELEDYSSWLMCDRAVTLRVPYDAHWPGRIRPFTTATARSAGWSWDIALQSRRGVGYVYSSQFISDDDAEAELRAFEGPHTGSLEARRLKFYVGQRKQHWANNVIACGLSSGFIEPLESTGLYLIEYAAVTLAEHFPRRADAMPIMAKRFNAILNQRYEEILDFVNLHYCLTQRSDTAFWREAQNPARVTDRLNAKLDFWRAKLPSGSDFDDHLRLFSHQSYEHILFGMGFESV